MEMNWNLDALYTGFQSEAFLQDTKRFEESPGLLTAIATDQMDDIQRLEKWIVSSRDANALAAKLMAFARLTVSTDASNKEALMAMDRLNQIYTGYTAPEVQFQEWLKTLENLDQLIDQSDILKEHRFHLQELKSEAEHKMSQPEEVLAAQMSTTGATAWTLLQNTVSSSLMVNVVKDGKEVEIPLMAARNMAFDKDPQIRLNGYHAELKTYATMDTVSASCLNGVKGEVLTLSKKRGFDHPLDQTLFNSRMDRETLDAMLEAMKEAMPKFRQYYRRKGELLGHKNGIPFYDMFAPMGSVETKYSYQEATDFVIKHFNSFSKELADFTQNAVDKAWIDVEPKKGKRGGAFCANLMPIGESRILLNFTGNLKNVITLAHELGHAYHGHILKDQSYLNASYPMPLAETASIFCETIVKNAALKEVDDEAAFAILETSISGSGQVIVDIYSRFLFETELFARRADHALSVDELKEIMINAQKQAYGDGVDHEALHPYMWMNKPHYYYAVNNFYNFPYAFGLLFAKGIYALYKEEGESFIPKYDQLLRATGMMNIADAAATLDINVRDKAFWTASLKELEGEIDRFLDLSQSKLG